MLNVVIFSKDRACQLELLLRSIKIFFRGWKQCKPVVLYAYSSSFYAEGYDRLKSIHPEFIYFCENDSLASFKAQVLSLISEKNLYSTFFVDDNVFRQPFSVADQEFSLFAGTGSILCLSLRLSPKIDYTYATNQIALPPSFEDHLTWNWQDMPAGTDWNYPMSLDGHIFRTHQLKPLIEKAEFSNPNFLEQALAADPIDLRKMSCYPESRVVNIPANRVQEAFPNWHGNLISPEDFNQMFLKGELISLNSILMVQNTSVHQEYPLELKTFSNKHLTPQLSVVVVCYNQAKVLPQFIEKLFAQSLDAFEIVIVDNGSTDSTREIAQCFADAYPKFQLQVFGQEIFDEDQAYQHGLKAARGEFKLCLNADQPICSTMLEKYLTLVEQAKDDGALSKSALFQWACQAQAAFEEAQAQLQIRLNQKQEGFKRSLTANQKLQSFIEERERCMQEMHDHLYTANSQLHARQTELVNAYNQLEKSRSQLEESHSQLHHTQSALNQAEARLGAMESSKFWKLRSKWMKVKQFLGLANEALTPNASTAPQLITISQEVWDEDLPLVSVVIPCFNYGQYLEEAINSVLSQTFQDFEIIVVDDGSDEPKTLQVLDNLTKPKTCLVRQSNKKLPAARNTGIKLARGKYICCLDADDLIRPTYLEKCLTKLESKNLDVCYSWIEEFGDSSEIHRMGEFDLELLIQHNCAPVSSVFKREMWERVGGYDESMIYGYEDWNFWIAIAKVGGLGGKVDEPLFLYRKHGRTMVDAALEQHKALYEQIQANHRELFTDPQLLKRVKDERKSYFVEPAFVNLARSYTVTETSQKQTGRVLFALPWLVTGGAETVTLQLAQTLKKDKFNITICTTESPPPSSGDSTPKFEPITSEIYHLYTFLDKDKWGSFVFHLIESRRINVIFLAGSTYFYNLLPDIKKNFPNVRIIDQLYNQSHIKNNRRYAQYIDLNVVENEAVSACLLEEYAEQIYKVRLIHNGVDTAHFNPETPSLSSQIDFLPLKNKFVITFMGRFSEEKGPDLFVEIVEQLRNNTEIHFLMAGDGPVRDQAVDLIVQYQLSDRILLPGFMDARECLRISNLLVVPSRIDGRPNSILESLSMGVPVVAAAVGGIPNIIENGYNGYVCEPENIQNFANCIRQIISDKDSYMKMKKNARQYALSEIDVAKSQGEYINVFGQLLDQQARTRV